MIPILCADGYWRCHALDCNRPLDVLNKRAGACCGVVAPLVRGINRRASFPFHRTPVRVADGPLEPRKCFYSLGFMELGFMEWDLGRGLYRKNISHGNG